MNGPPKASPKPKAAKQGGRSKFYEVTFTDTGRTYIWDLARCEEIFGVREWPEYRLGYLPNVIVFEREA